MARVAVEVTPDFRHVSEGYQRSVAAHLRVIMAAYLANEDIQKAVSAWHAEAVVESMKPERLPCPTCKGSGKDQYQGRCQPCQGTGKKA